MLAGECADKEKQPNDNRYDRQKRRPGQGLPYCVQPGRRPFGDGNAETCVIERVREVDNPLTGRRYRHRRNR